MIEFFRKIRQRLLNENKFRKYLLYAIGEIVLVVIGILIALQINDWNQESLDKRKELYYLHSLKEDLTRQEREFEDHFEQETFHRDQAQKIVDYFETNDEFVSMEDFYSKINNLIYRDVPTYFTSNLEELISTGNIGLISNDTLRSHLLEYYKYMKSNQKNYESNIYNIVDQQITPILSRYSLMNLKTFGINSQLFIQPLESSDKKQKTNSSLKQIADQQLSKPENTLLLYNHINLRILIAQVHIRENQVNILEVDEMIFMIEKEIEELVKSHSSKINKETNGYKSLKTLFHKGKTVDEIIVEVKKQDREHPVYNISEGEINSLGYFYLYTLNMPKNALKVFELNIELYPDAWNTYDSYGECLLRLGDKKNGIKAYKKSLELNPENENAFKVLQGL